MCPRCAADGDALIELHGGRGAEAISLEHDVRVATRPRAAQRRALGFTARWIVYLVVALVAFVLVTLITAHGR